MSDDIKKTELVAYMRRINDGSALSETLREARALKAETESLRAENARLKAALERVRAMATLVLEGAEALDTIEALRAERDRLRNEKVAGGPRPEAMGGTPPATDPAPAVCEWTDSGGMLWATECWCSYAGFVSLFVRYRFVRDAYCPHCRQPIKFTEAKE